MNTNKEDMRELAAQLYALVISTMTGNELQTAVQHLVKITKDNHVCHFVSVTQQFIFFSFYTLCVFIIVYIYFICFLDSQSPETQHGAILALGYMVGRNMSRKKAAASPDSTRNVGQQMNIAAQEDDELVAMATKTIGV